MDVDVDAYKLYSCHAIIDAKSSFYYSSLVVFSSRRHRIDSLVSFTFKIFLITFLLLFFLLIFWSSLRRKLRRQFARLTSGCILKISQRILDLGQPGRTRSMKKRIGDELPYFYVFSSAKTAHFAKIFSNLWTTAVKKCIFSVKNCQRIKKREKWCQDCRREKVSFCYKNLALSIILELFRFMRKDWKVFYHFYFFNYLTICVTYKIQISRRIGCDTIWQFSILFPQRVLSSFRYRTQRKWNLLAFRNIDTELVDSAVNLEYRTGWIE